MAKVERLQAGFKMLPRTVVLYNLQGVCLKRNATQDDVDALAPGLYIIGGKKVLVK